MQSTLPRPILILLLVWTLGPFQVPGQGETKVPLFADPDLDTAYIQTTERDSWSIRAFANTKFHSLLLRSRDTDSEVRYLPNNTIGVGLGFVYRFILIDVGLNLKLERTDATRRFDAQIDFMVKQKHIFNFQFQKYTGMDQFNKGQKVAFRPDLVTGAYGLQYFRNFNDKKLSIKSVIRGDLIQKKSTWAWFIGGYLTYLRLRADSSISAFAREDILDRDYRVRGHDLVVFGFSFGGAYSWAISRRFALYGALLPGIGGTTGSVRALDRTFAPPLFPSGGLKVNFSFGYLPRRFYLLLSSNFNASFIPLGDRHFYLYGIGKVKLVFGWRFRRKIKGLEKVNDRFSK